MEARAGETVERPVKWPDDFPDEAQRSKTKTVRVTLQDVKRKTLPELDDAFAREVGDFESLDALRKAVRDDLEANAQRETESEVRQRLLAARLRQAGREIADGHVRAQVNGDLRRSARSDRVAQRPRKCVDGASLDAARGDERLAAYAPVAEIQGDALQRLTLEAL